MADNVIVNIPTTIGATIATEDVSGVQHQKIKIEFGPDGVATMVDNNNPLPVIDADLEASAASIDNKLTDNSQKTQIVDAAGNAVTVSGNKLDVNATFAGTVSENIAELGSNAINTNAGNAGAGTMRVVLATDQPQLTNALKVDGSAVTQPVSGTVAVNNFPATQPVSGTVAISNFPATQPISAVALPLPTGAATSAAQTDKSQFTKLTDGTDTALVTAAGELNVLPTAQPGVDIGDVTVNNGSGAGAVNIQDGGNSITIDAASLPLPTGAATAALQTQPGVDIGDVTVNNASGGAAVNIQDGGNSITVDGSVTANAGTNLNTSLLALESGGNLASIKTNTDKIPSQGQAAMAASTPVVIASNQSAVPISAASLPLPTGAATSANQATEIASLASIDAGIPAGLGQTTMSASMPVVLASDQSAIPVTFSGLATDNTTVYSGTLAVGGAITGFLTTGYASIVAQITGTWNGNFIFEGSNDNATWYQLFAFNLDEFNTSDLFSGNGNYLIKSSTKYLRLNILQVTGSLVALIVGRTVIGVDASDMLSIAMDKNNNAPLYVSEINSKKDASQALIPSDAPAPVYGFAQATNSILFQVDTTGYQSVVVQALTAGSNATIQTSNDGITWFSLLGYNGNNLATPSATLSTAAMYEYPALGRYVRGLMTGANFTNCLVYLRQRPVNTTNLTLGQSTNITGINGNAIASTGLSGVLPVSGTAANGIAPTANPNLIAGIDNTATGGLTRRVLVDTSGRIITAGTDTTGTTRPIGVLSPSSNPYNVAPTVVMDVSTNEGQSIPELLAQILIELKINNQYMYDLPLTLQKGLSTLNNSNNTLNYPFLTEPNEMRNDATLFAV